MNIDEGDFFDHGSGPPAFMHVKIADSGGISIGLAIENHSGLDLTVSVEDAHRLGERLVAAASDVAAD